MTEKRKPRIAIPKPAAAFLKKTGKRAAAFLAPAGAWFRKTWRYLFPPVMALIAVLLLMTGMLNRPDRWAQDSLFQEPGVPSGDILIIGIDQKALDELGPYPWPRSVMAAALETLASDPDNLPAAVGVDVLYSGTTTENADARLAKAAEKLGCMVTACMAHFGSEITWEEGRAVAWETKALDWEEPYEALRAVARQGHINAMMDGDGILRHCILWVEAGGRRVESMPVQVARLYAENRGRTLALPAASASGQCYVPFTGKPGAYIEGLSVVDLIYRRIDPAFWAGKIVLIGACAPSLGDAYFTSADAGEKMYGIEFQANVIQSLTEGNSKAVVPDWPQYAILFVILTAAGWFLLRLKVLWGALLSIGLALAGGVLSLLLYRSGLVTHVLWLPFGAAMAYLASMVVHYAQVIRERRALALEKERVATELALATRIQASSLPSTFPAFPERKDFDLYASMTPAREVGGDLYDFYLIDDDHLCLVIGDVSGKGVPASLFMMLARALIHHVAMHELSPARVLTEVNAEICARNPEEMFVTVWLGVLELSTGKLTAASAGHEYPALRQPGEDFALLQDRHGFVLGGMEGVRYREYELTLNPGASLFVYTDGVPEATDGNAQMFGTDRMIEALRRAQDESPKDLLAGVGSAVNAFVNGAEQFDDLTMLCVHYLGPQGA